ncbi:hypothetical protein HPB50_004854 [Hyalomma asiaticum]|uniref:Uncharacterized protein n=1 Tax=Hyalomma asiaticum TaxID=266040 RepID=A0ACB7SEH6_HYAAI|nr:hypothetical protein HPB50_004854 [Hyalomma asiaticum]
MRPTASKQEEEMSGGSAPHNNDGALMDRQAPEPYIEPDASEGEPLQDPDHRYYAIAVAVLLTLWLAHTFLRLIFIVDGAKGRGDSSVAETVYQLVDSAYFGLLLVLIFEQAELAYALF